MIAFLFGFYVGGFVVCALITKGGLLNKLVSSAIWPLRLAWIYLTPA